MLNERQIGFLDALEMVQAWMTRSIDLDELEIMLVGAIAELKELMND